MDVHWIKSLVHCMLQWEEERGGKGIPRTPPPLAAPVRFPDLHVSFVIVANNKNSDVVLVFSGEDVIGHRGYTRIFDGDAAFLHDFTARAFLETFTEFEVSSGEGPRVRTVCTMTQAQENLVIVQDENSNSDAGISFHRNGL